MKKLALALAATAALGGQAIAADMPARVTKAPVVAPVAVANWTGCYIGGGGGYGLWNQETTQYFDGPPRVRQTDEYTIGGRGWFGTVQGGCDYQFGLGTYQVVIGGFGDYDFAGMKGNFTQEIGNRTGQEKLSSSWAAGGRIGVLITPNLLTYFSAGYTESTFDRFNLHFINTPDDVYLDKLTYKGWFLGSGYEYGLSFLPGLFWKTEYRFSDLDTQTNRMRLIATNALTGDSWDSHKYVHTVRSELVWRFNWAGPVVAKY